MLLLLGCCKGVGSMAGSCSWRPVRAARSSLARPISLHCHLAVHGQRQHGWCISPQWKYLARLRQSGTSWTLAALATEQVAQTLVSVRRQGCCADLCASGGHPVLKSCGGTDSERGRLEERLGCQRRCGSASELGELTYTHCTVVERGADLPNVLQLWWWTGWRPGVGSAST